MFKLIDDWLDGIAGRNGLFRIAAGELDCRYKRLVLDLDGCAYDISGIVRAFGVYDRSDRHVFVILWNISRYDYFTFARNFIVCQSGDQMADIYFLSVFEYNNDVFDLVSGHDFLGLVFDNLKIGIGLQDSDFHCGHIVVVVTFGNNLRFVFTASAIAHGSLNSDGFCFGVSDDFKRSFRES